MGMARAGNRLPAPAAKQNPGEENSFRQLRLNQWVKQAVRWIPMENREEIIGDCRAVMEALADCGSIDAEMEAVSDEMEVTAGLIQKLVDENAARKLDQHDYRKKYDGYASRYAALESRMDSLEKERERKEIQYDLFSGFLAGLGETEELPVDFNEKLFHRLVDYATVYPDGRVVFTFRNSAEVSTKI